MKKILQKIGDNIIISMSKSNNMEEIYFLYNIGSLYEYMVKYYFDIDLE